jgi:flagellar biogenesis protein FliO
VSGVGGEKIMGFRRAIFLMTLVLLTHGAVWSQTTQKSAGIYDDQPIQLNGRDNPTTKLATEKDTARPANIVDPRRLILALAIVLGIIFALRWVGRKYFPAVGPKASSAVRVLSRSPIAPKRQVLLVQVGRRVLVLADNGTQLNPLSEITDADEVAGLIGQTASSAAPGVFDSAFGKARESFEDTMPAPAPSALDQTESSPHESEPTSDEQPAPENVGLAQGEIKDLMEKVRGLAQQLGGPS